MANDTFRQDPTPDEHRWLLCNLAQIIIFAGRLASDDVGNTMSDRATTPSLVDTARYVGHGQLAGIRPALHRAARRHRGHCLRRPKRAPIRPQHHHHGTRHAARDTRRQRTLLFIDLVTAELHAANFPDARAGATEGAAFYTSTPNLLHQELFTTSGFPYCRSAGP